MGYSNPDFNVYAEGSKAGPLGKTYADDWFAAQTLLTAREPSGEYFWTFAYRRAFQRKGEETREYAMQVNKVPVRAERFCWPVMVS